MIPMTAKMAITGAHSRACSGKIGMAIRMKP